VPGSTLTPTAHEVLKPDQRDIDWEGRKMLAIQLPGADENAAWLIAAPTLWDQFHATITRFAPRGAPPQPDAAEATSSDKARANRRAVLKILVIRGPGQFRSRAVLMAEEPEDFVTSSSDQGLR